MQQTFEVEPSAENNDAKSPQAEKCENCVAGVLPFKDPRTSKRQRVSAKNP